MVPNDDDELHWNGADEVTVGPAEPRPAAPERTPDMVAQGQHWVWLAGLGRWEIKGTGARLEPVIDLGFLSLPWELQEALTARCESLKLPFGSFDPYRCERPAVHGGDHCARWVEANGHRRRARWNDDGQLYREDDDGAL